MNLKVPTLGLLLAASLQASANADMTGLMLYRSVIDSHTVINVSAEFDDESNAVLNVFNAEISTEDGLGFHHDDIAGGN